MNPFHSESRSHHGTETVLVTLLGDLLREADWGSVTLFVLLDLSAALVTISHDIFLDWLLRSGGWKLSSVLASFLP